MNIKRNSFLQIVVFPTSVHAIGLSLIEIYRDQRTFGTLNNLFLGLFEQESGILNSMNA